MPLPFHLSLLSELTKPAPMPTAMAAF
uniref:Uncharacterized protein n=1 Tax=Arundo donax TaxID=35708 RepID=A0A0A8YMP1_ARUDO